MKTAHRPLVEAWYGGAAWLYFLRPLEFLFRIVVATRRWAYSAGLLRCYAADVAVVIVGNITVGGAGKTPVVIALVEALQEQGLRVGVVGRGYGATAKEFPHKVSEHSTVAECGDEALLIYQRTQCPCVVAPSRV
ncbi:MAG: tetraacyldisaccharide 4'-kinase, partial [Halioglobus sp.]